MGKFKANKRIALAFVGDDWKDAYIVASVPSMTEAQDIAVATAPDDLEQAKALANKVMDFLKSQFVSGEAPVDGKLEPVTADDLPELPLTVIAELRNQLVGEKALGPNS